MIVRSVILLLLSCWATCPARGQVITDLPPEGYAAVASMENFIPRGRPAVVDERGLVVPGIVRRETADGIESSAYLWHVEAGTFELITPPADNDDVPPGRLDLVCINTRGQLLVNVVSRLVQERRTTSVAYVRGPDGGWTVVGPAADQGEELMPSCFLASDMNRHGVVVGNSVDGREWHTLGCYRWSRELGLQRYKDNRPWWPDALYEINDDGVAVGRVRDTAEGRGTRHRPVVCYDIDDVFVLESEDENALASAERINNAGQVLLAEYDVVGVETAYWLWEEGEEATDLPSPARIGDEVTWVSGLSDRGAILVGKRDFGQDRVASEAYLVDTDRRQVLPDYPGAPEAHTVYSAMSREGYIVGYVVFEPGSVTTVGRNVAFVLSPDAELAVDE